MTLYFTNSRLSNFRSSNLLSSILARVARLASLTKVQNVPFHDRKLVLTQIAQVVPAVDARFVQVVKLEQNAVMSLGFYANDVHILASVDEALLVAAAMPLHLRTWAFHAQILCRQFHLTTIRPLDIQVL